jgi:hypothetical protein
MSSFVSRSTRSIIACIALLMLTASCSDLIKRLDATFNDKAKRASPQAEAAASLNGTTIRINYGQPSKKGREIFGKLVPYGEVWRLGANEATEITLSNDVTVAGKALKAGRYTLCAIPQPNSWTIVFNSKLGQWGAFFYDQKDDVLRVDVPASSADAVTEKLTLTFDTPKTAEGTATNTANLSILWDKTTVLVPFTVK